MKKNRLKLVFIPVIISLVFSSCSMSDMISKFTKGKKEADEPLVYNTLDISEASQNYYEYVNGNWIKDTELPAYRPVVSTFSEIAINNNDNFYAMLLDSVEKGTYKKNSDLGMVSRFFYTARDFKSRDAEGFDPIKPYLENIDKIKNIKEFEDQVIELGKLGISSLYNCGSSADLNDSQTERLYVYGPNLGLGQKENYNISEKNPNRETILTYQAAYKNTLTTMFSDITNDEAAAEKIATNVIDIESKIATSLLDVEVASNPEYYYNKENIYTFSDKFKNANFKRVIEGIGYVSPEFVIICEKDYHNKLDELMVEENLEALKDFLSSKVVMFSAEMLSKKTCDDYQGLQNVLMGTSGFYPEDSLAFSSTYDYMGYFLGKIYYEENFTESDRKYVEQMIKDIIDQYAVRLENVEWLTAETREAAISKINKMKIKVGGPKEWSNAKDVYEINTPDKGGSLFKNVIGMTTLSVMSNAYSIDQPVYEDEWLMPAHSVNAYYAPAKNEIVFPAGILQAPFYSSSYTDSQNYGGIGIVIAHEISHAFDDTGRLHDENGNLNDWWTPEDVKKFEEISQKLVDQYNKAEVLPGLYVNGKLTLGENIADLGAVSCITDIIKNMPDGNLDEAYKSFATVFREKATDEYQKYVLALDPHTPSEFRINIPLANTDDYYELYDIKEDDEMYIAPENRVKIW